MKRGIRKAEIGHQPDHRLATFNVNNLNVELGMDSLINIEALADDSLDLIKVVPRKGL